MDSEKVMAIIAEHFDIDAATLSEETRFVEDLHADSLDLVELIMAFEDAFGITVSDEAALEVKTIGDILKM